MVNKKKASLELTLLVLIMSLFIIGVGIYGVLKIRELNNSSRELYADRILPMDQLGDIRFYTSNIIATAHQIDGKQIDYNEALQKITSAQDSIAKNWKNYQQTYLTDKEKQLVVKTRSKIDLSNRTIEKLKLALKTEDADLLDSILKNELYPNLNSVILEASTLLRMQVEIGKEINQNNAKGYTAFTQEIFWILIIAFGLVLPFAYYLIKKNSAIISSLNLNNVKLFLTEKNYRNLIEYAGEAILILDEETNIIDLNDVACALLGYTRSELLEMRISDLVTEKEIEKQIEDINSIKKDKFAIVSRKIIKKDGSFIETEISNKLMEGKGFFSIIHDITERKKAEKILQRSEEKYRYLFDNNPACIVIWDLVTLEILKINNAVLDKYGYSNEEWEKMSVLDYRPKDGYEMIKDFAQKMLKSTGLVTKGNWCHYKKNGEEMIMEITSHKINYNNRKAILSLAQDVTDQIKAENELKQSEEKYHSLVEHAGDAIFVVDENINIIEVNTSACELLGYSRNELVAMSAVDVYPPNDLIQPVRWDLLRQNKTLLNETKLQRKNGTIVEVEVNRKLLNNNNYLAIVRDITERKKIESELVESKEQLRLFIEHSPASLAMFDSNMCYIATSRRWVSDYNLEDQDIIGKNHYEVFPEIDQEWKNIHQRCLQGVIEKREEDSFLRADGSMQWVKWEVRPWHKATGEIGGIIMFTEIITERKKATEMFKNQFENSPDTILYVNRDLKIEAINRGGVNWTKEELIGMDCISILPEESQNIVKECVIKCFATGEHQEIESQLSGHRWARSRMVPLFVKDEVINIVIFSTDITQQRKAERKLLESEEKHRALTENISDAILLLNEEAQIVYQSPSAERISGYSFEDAKDRCITEFLPSEELFRGQLFLKEILETPNLPKHNQFRIIHKKGHEIWIEGTAINLLEKDSVKGIILNYRDITKRKELEVQQALTASIVNSSDDAIISKTLEGVITSWNKGAEKILGYSAEETIGSTISMLIPERLKGEEKEILSQIASGYSVDHVETVRQKKSGELIDVSLTISPIYDVLGNVIGASKIMRDITDRKIFEDELIRYNTELKKTNTELDRFVYSASHDLRAPLKSMLGLIYITNEDIKENRTSNDSFVIAERLDLLNASVIKLDNLIEDILNYSRNSRLESVYEEIDIEDIVNDVRNHLRFIEEKQINFGVSVNSNPKLISDSKRLKMILNNIISNAYKYSDVTKEKSFINVIFTVDVNKAIIVIEDNGIGIAENEKEKIFNMFYRSTAMSTGSGLGLYIVKEVIEKLEGKISVESVFGKSSKFRIEIPNQLNNVANFI